jgi:hypothetical protein
MSPADEEKLARLSLAEFEGVAYRQQSCSTSWLR